ncbi:patatin-like phospholipase family protein [Aliidiomarina celeris]|uniref:patatin-like phospholipase family protein n=1 Tax=Aliidiomarina celeris TaxID=2249428 RepID=UPI000DE81E68|nr:patatin-like phospholipase family protein [Aliidiomarina celeris]
MISSREPALLLAGGGARAAYQVGVLKAIATLVPRAHPLPFRILCGTSAGALNASALASYASNFRLGVKHLEKTWGEFRTEQVYRCSTGELFGHLLGRVGRMFQSESTERPAASLFDNQPLRELLNTVVDFKRIDRHIHQGYLRAVAITASCYNNGESVSFYEGIPQYEDWLRAKRRGTRTRLTSEHLMASAAIPLVFPAIKVGQHFFGDGSVHQMSPLSPAIHLGASKILVIGMDPPQTEDALHRPYVPSSAAVAGHLLDTIFADTLNADVERLERINDTIFRLEQAGMTHPTLRRIDSLLIQPELDFTEVAHKHYHRLPKPVQKLLNLIGVDRDTPSSIVSYLLFEKEYCQELIQLGFEQALKNEDQLHAYLELGGRPVE